MTQISDPPAVVPASLPPERIRLEFVDGLRALAALFVVLSHAWANIPGRIDSWWTGWLYNGQLAVDLFMVVSGFCLALPMAQPQSFGTLRGGAWAFTLRRARRILPPYYFSVAASLLLIWTLVGKPTGTHWDVALPVTSKVIVAHLLLLQDVVYQARINHAHWSIALEWQIYFLLPLIALGWRKFGTIPTTAIAIALAYVAFFAARSMHLRNESPWMLGYIALFAIGTLAALVGASSQARWQEARKPLPWTLAALLLLTALTGMLIKAGGMGSHLRAVIDFTMGLFSAALLVLACCPGKNHLRDILCSRPLVFIGTFAYSIYLMHAPLLQVVWQYAIAPLHVGWRTQFFLLAGVGIPAIVGACYLFFLGCEKPWLAQRPRETMRQIARDAAVSPAP